MSFAGSLFFCWLTVYIFLPKPELLDTISYSKAYTDKNNKLLNITLADDERYRLLTPIDKISPYLKEATVLYEDKSFYRHHGVDSFALIRAFWSTYIMQNRRIGASTITMQLARLRWGIQSNTLLGKLHQIIRAIQLDRHYSKNDILEAYLNLAPYGRNIEGVGAASLIYFNKAANDLSFPEALTLAVIPQNPNKRLPTSKQGIFQLNAARNRLAKLWLSLYPNSKHYEKFISLPLYARSLEQLPFIAPHFLNYLNVTQSRWQSGLIKTSLDSNKQKTMQDIISHYVEAHSNIGIKNASALLVNYKTMKIESMVGSANFFDDSISGQVNGVVAKRSPGSTLKPFVYGLAIDEGLIHPMTLLKDSPTRFAGFTPENYDRKFLGPILASDALIESRNVPAVDLQAKLSKKSFYQFLQAAGVKNLRDESFYGLALALGGGELSMLELVKLYALLANMGSLNQVSGIADTPITAGERLLSPEASYIILDILKDNPPPYQRFSTSISTNNEIAWKTGTSWAFRDAWAIGISGDYVLAVWVGNFDGSKNPAFVGRTAAGPLLFSLFRALVSNQGWTVEEAFFNSTLNIKKIDMCKKTGDLPGKYCPHTQQGLFIPGVSPLKVETVYRTVDIDRISDQRACWYDPKTSEKQVYEFWPSDFLNIFEQAGIYLKKPPAYKEVCELEAKSHLGHRPIILSPQSTIDYVLSLQNQSLKTIIFNATVDSDADKVFWFVDNAFVGSTPINKPFYWEAQPGEFIIRAVDNLGRSNSRSLKVISVP